MKSASQTLIYLSVHQLQYLPMMTIFVIPQRQV